MGRALEGRSKSNLECFRVFRDVLLPISELRCICTTTCKLILNGPSRDAGGLQCRIPNLEVDVSVIGLSLSLSMYLSR